jgi:hypothetical protein
MCGLSWCRSIAKKLCRCADGLAELEVQGDKDLKVRFYNIEDALDERSWIAGIISETFGRKVGILHLKHLDVLSTASGDARSVESVLSDPHCKSPAWPLPTPFLM